MGFPGFGEQLEQSLLEGGRDPELVAQVAGEADPGHERRNHSQVHPAHVQEPEGVVGDVHVGQRRKHLAGRRTGDGESCHLMGERSVGHPVTGVRELRSEPTLVMALGGSRPEDQEPLRALGPIGRVGRRGDGRNREVTDQHALMVEHGSEGHPTGFRYAVGHGPFQEGAGARAGELVLGEAGGLQKAHPRACRMDLLGDHVEGVGPVERDLLHRFGSRPLEPQRILEAVARSPDGVRRIQLVVDRRRVQGPSRR